VDLQDEKMKEICLNIGQINGASAARMLRYTPYSYRDSSVRKRRAYKALFNYLRHQFHPVNQTKTEKDKMIHALTLIPKKKIDNESFHFTKGETIYSAEYDKKVKTLKEVTGIKTLDIEYSSEESDYSQSVFGENTKLGSFDADEMVAKICTCIFYKRPGWYEKAKIPRPHSRIIPQVIHEYLISLHQFDSLDFDDEADLAESLERRFPFQTGLKVRKRVKKKKQVIEKYVIRPETTTTTYNYDPVHIHDVKFEGNWVEECIQLTYKPGFSVIRSEMMPYKCINEKYARLPESSTKRTKKKEKKRSQGLSKFLTKKRKKRMGNVEEMTNEEMDDYLRIGFRDLIVNKKAYLQPKKIYSYQLRRFYNFSWQTAKLVNAMLNGIKHGTDPYAYLRMQHEAFYRHRRSMGVRYGSDD
jgi:hypothetical protein